MSTSQKPRIGVYICHGSLNISGTVDAESVAEYAKNLPDVIVSKDYENTCSDLVQEMIKKDIKEQKLNRIIVAACSPTMHEHTFRKLLEESGLNPHFFEMVNIREKVSWVHMKDPVKATKKAKNLVKMAVARAALLQPLEEQDVPVLKSVLVIGGGIAGIQAALDLADQDYKVTIVERKPTLGGHMAQLGKTFPTMENLIDIFGPKMVDAYKNPNITILVNSEVLDISGEAGNFHTKILKKAKFVDEKKCTGCDICTTACPITIPSEFDTNLGRRKAIYTPFPQGVPAKFTIDKEHCLHFTKGECKVCEEICEAKAIDFVQNDQVIEFDVGAIVVATGFDIYDPLKLKEWGYKKYPNVITNLDLEKLISTSGPNEGKLVRPSDGKEPHSIAFIQCVGSRDIRAGNLYCSNTCCMTSLKQAHQLKEDHPETEIYIFYIDLRCFSKGYEEFYNQVQKDGVRFNKGIPSELIENPTTHNINLRSADMVLGEMVEKEFDMAVLAVGMVPPKGLAELANKLKIPRGTDGFLLESHPKIKPVDTPTTGIFLAGAVQGPKDIATTVAQAKAAASSAASMLSKGKVKAETYIANVSDEKCTEYDHCELVCPYNMKDPEKENRKAKDLIKMEAAKATLLKPSEELGVPALKSVLVIGGGIAGIQAALDLADQDYKVTVVEKKPTLGGHMAQLDKTFPMMDRSICVFGPKMVDAYKNPNITILVNSEVLDISGEAGNFHTKILKKAKFVDEKKCTGCGACATKCPVETPNEFNMNLGRSKAIYIPFPQRVPAKYTINKEHCLFFTKGECKVCEEMCEAKAIDFKQVDQVVELDVGAIIVTTGFDTFDPSKQEVWGYKKYPNVVSSLDLERLISAFGPNEGKLVRPSDGKEPHSIAFIQCVGSRDKQSGNLYCSNTCCMTSLKQAVLLKEKHPDYEIYVFYIDIRAFGKGVEEFYRRARSNFITFIRGKVSEIVENKKTGNLLLRFEDTLSGEVMEKEFDMAVLAVGMVPPKGLAELANKLKIPRGTDGFLLESHPKIKPVDTPTTGIFLAGAVQGPKDIATTVAQAKAAASSAASFLSRARIRVETSKVKVNEEKYLGYGVCELGSRYKAG